MRRFVNTLTTIAALFLANMKTHHAEAKKTLMMAFFMAFQNMIFFSMWIVFFSSIQQVKGWQLSEVALMFGVIATAVGLSLTAADGVRTLTMKILDGSIDAYLTKPRHPLPFILLSRSGAASLGDLLSGPIFVFTLGKASLAQAPFLLLLALLSAVIFLSAIVMFYSLAFWVTRGSRFSDQLFETLIIFSSVPQHAQPFGIKFVMFSVLPAGFITMMPVALLHRFNGLDLALLAGGAVFYALLAVLVFNAGVRRYVSG